MAAWYKNQGKTLVDGLNEIYNEYGYYLDFLDSFVLKGKDGAEKIQSLMTEFRSKGISLFDALKKSLIFQAVFVIYLRKMYLNIYGMTAHGLLFVLRVQSLRLRLIIQLLPV